MAIGTYQPVDPVHPPHMEPPPGPIFKQQTGWDRFTRKFKEEPLVPLGIAATVFALAGATNALQKGNRTQFNQFLRYRVAAQGLTVMAALGGSIYYSSSRQAARRKENTLVPENVAATIEAQDASGPTITATTAKAADPPAAAPPTPTPTKVIEAAQDRRLV